MSKPAYFIENKTIFFYARTRHKIIVSEKRDKIFNLLQQLFILIRLHIRRICNLIYALNYFYRLHKNCHYDGSITSYFLNYYWIIFFYLKWETSDCFQILLSTCLPLYTCKIIKIAYTNLRVFNFIINLFSHNSRCFYQMAESKYLVHDFSCWIRRCAWNSETFCR